MPRPTEAQKSAGNYPKDHLWLRGLSIAVENRKGTIRSGTGKDGRPWSVQLPYSYGYLKRTLGADGDHVDVFIGPNRNSDFVLVVNQYDNQTGAFDEIKVGLCYDSEQQAKAAYRKGYSGGAVPRAEFRTTTVQRLKEWLRLKQTWSKFDFQARPERLTEFAIPMKQRPDPKQPEEKSSTIRKVAAAVGAGATIAAFYKYSSTRPDVKKHAARMKRAQVASDPVRSARLKTTAYTQGLKKQPTPRHTPAYDGGAGFDYGVKPAPAPAQPAAVQTASVKVRGGSLLKRKVLNSAPMTPADRRAAKIKAGWKQVSQTTALRARVPLTHFQDRNHDGTLGVSTSPLTAYRKASRVVPWVGRAGQAAGDIGDIAAGKEVKDPFYKKTWFKRAATTAAIGLPLLAANLARSGERKQADRLKPSTGTTYADKVDRLTHSAANMKRKAVAKLGLSAKIKKPILLQAVVRHLQNFDTPEKKPRNRWAAPVAIGLAGVAAAGGVGAYLGVKKLRGSLQPSLDKLPGTLDAIRTASGQVAKTATGAASSVKAASDSLRGSVDKIGHVAGAVQASTGKTWLRRRLGFATKLKPILLQAVVTHLQNFDYTDRNNWDLRDARGKSARVFAPGSKPRNRREKDWNEKTDNIRLVRNIAIAGTLAGAGAALHYRNKASKLTPKIPKATNVIDGVDFRKPKMASAKIRLTQFARPSGPALSRLIDATKANVSLPDRPDLPGEGAVKLVVGLPPKRRAGVLKILGAGALAGTGVAAGVLSKRPKTGAALGGLGAGLILG